MHTRTSAFVRSEINVRFMFAKCLNVHASTTTTTHIGQRCDSIDWYTAGPTRPDTHTHKHTQIQAPMRSNVINKKRVKPTKASACLCRRLCVANCVFFLCLDRLRSLFAHCPLSHSFRFARNASAMPTRAPRATLPCCSYMCICIYSRFDAAALNACRTDNRNA